MVALQYLFTLFSAAAAKLVWQDEFDQCPSGRPDPANWNYEHGMVRNNEAQWYQPDNALCVNGSLVITAERVTPSAAKGNAKYTSSSLITAGLHEFQYGRFEMRAKIDIRLGSWPAFWTIGNDTSKIGWPKCGEIDIMEFYRGKVLANIMYAKTNGAQQWSSKTKPVAQQWAEDFHVWAMDWTDKEVTLSLDDVVMNSVKVSDAPAQGKYPNPFKQPLYIIINQALGGTNGGDPSKTNFPLKYEIDYIRVYDKANPPEPSPTPAPGPPPPLNACQETCKAKNEQGCCEYDPSLTSLEWSCTSAAINTVFSNNTCSGSCSSECNDGACSCVEPSRNAVDLLDLHGGAPLIGCAWHAGDYVQGGTSKPGAFAANCRSDGCDGWNANEKCGKQ
jgi:beta-glucanase (GH16 family)